MKEGGGGGGGGGGVRGGGRGWGGGRGGGLVHEPVLVEHIQLVHASDPAGDEVACSTPTPPTAGSPWDMVVMVAALMEVVGEEGKVGVVLTLLLLLPTSSSIGRVQCSSP